MWLTERLLFVCILMFSSKQSSVAIAGNDKVAFCVDVREPIAAKLPSKLEVGTERPFGFKHLKEVVH